MASVLISIKPKWCELIASGKKTIEVRKTKPKLETPFKCYIYETKGKTETPTFIDEDGHVICEGRGQVIGEFICDKIICVDCDSTAPFDKESRKYIDKETCLDREQLIKYSEFICPYGWHISNLIIYDKPKELSEFCKRPPQSWRYIEV